MREYLCTILTFLLLLSTALAIGVTIQGKDLNVYEGNILVYNGSIIGSPQTTIRNNLYVDENITTTNLFVTGLRANTGVFVSGVYLNYLSSGCDVLGTASGGKIICSSVSFVNGTGDVNYLPKWVSSTALGNSIIYDDGTNIGIGTESPGAKLDVNGGTIIRGGLDMKNTAISGVDRLYINDIGKDDGVLFPGVGGISVWTTTQGSENAFVFQTTSTYPFKFKIGASDVLTVDSASLSTPLSVYAPIFYDSDNMSYYLNPAGSSELNEINVSSESVGILTVRNILYSSAIYDKDDTGFYVDPNQISVLQDLNITGLLNGGVPITSENIASYAVTSITAGTGLAGGGGPGAVSIALAYPSLSCGEGNVIQAFDLGSGTVTCLAADTNTTNEIQNIFQNVSDGVNVATADSPTDTLYIQDGPGISISVDSTTDTVTITNTGDTNPSDDVTAGTVSANYVTKWTGTGNEITSSQIYDDGTNVGIGTSSPSYKLDVSGDIRAASAVITDTLKLNSQYLILRAPGSNNINLYSIFQGDALAYKVPYKVERYNPSTGLWEDITSSATWGYMFDLRADSAVAFGNFAVTNGSVDEADIRIYIDMGGRWRAPGAVLVVYLQHFPTVDKVVVEQADDSAITTNVDTLADISGTIGVFDGTLVIPLTGTLWRQYVRIEIKGHRTTGTTDGMYVRDIAVLSTGYWGQGLLNSVLPFWWNYAKQIGFYNTVYPMSNNSYDLGTSSKKWKNAYIAGTTYTGTLSVTSNANVGGTVYADTVDAGQYKISGTIVITADRNITNINSITAAGPMNIDSGTLYVDSANNRVGIGTTSPPTFFTAQNAYSIGSYSTWFALRASGTNKYLGFGYDNTNDYGFIRSWEAGIGDKKLLVEANPLSVKANVYPSASNTYDLGSTAYKWKNIYVAGTTYTGSIRWGNNSLISGDQGGSIELGGDNSTAGTGTPYIDFHYNGSTADYDVRLRIVGTDTLAVEGGILRLTTLPNCSKLYTDSSGNIQCGTDQTGITGSGDLNYIPKWVGSTVLGNSQIYDNGTNVGIGTTTPTAKLDVAGNIKTSDKIYSSNWYVSNNAGQAQLWLSNSSSGDEAKISRWADRLEIMSSDAIGFSIGAVGSTKMWLNSSGRLGIGTTSPKYWLDVRKTGTYVFRLGGANGNDLTFDIAAGAGLANITAGAEWNGTTYVYTGTRGASRIEFHDGTFYLYVGGTSGTAGSPVSWKTVMKGTSAGNAYFPNSVGIGTSSPAAKLHVYGTSVVALFGNPGSGYSALRFVGSNSDDYAYIQAGTSSTDTTANLRISRYATTTSTLNRLEMYADTTYVSGNVGIGVASPSYKLDVSGKVNAAGYCINGDCITSWSDVGGEQWSKTTVDTSYTVLAPTDTTVQGICLDASCTARMYYDSTQGALIIRVG